MDKCVLPRLLFVYLLIFFKNHYFGVKCGENAAIDVSPLVGEMFDLFLKHIEMNRRGKYKLSGDEFRNDKLSGDSVNAKVPHTENKNKSYIDLLNGKSKMTPNINLEIFKIVGNEITFKDDKVSVSLNLITKGRFGKNSVLSFKNLETQNREITDSTQLCSSNTKDVMFTEVSDYSTIEKKNGNTEYSLTFEINHELKTFLNKTFVICLSDSLESEYSIYITQLSFSDLKNKNLNEEYDLNESIDDVNVNIGNYISDNISNVSSNGENVPRFYFNEFENEDSNEILLKNVIKKDETCNDFSLMIFNKKGKKVTNGIAYYNMNERGNICFWTLILKKDHFIENEYNHIKGMTYSPLLVLLINKKSDSDHKLISTVTYSYEQRYEKVKFFNSFIFRLSFLVMVSIPILLLAYCFLVIICDLLDLVLFKLTKSHLTKKIISYTQNALTKRFMTKNSENKNMGRKRISSWHNRKDNKINDCEIADKYDEIDISTQYDESGNSSSDNSINNKYKHVFKDDPLKYFDSDCSISTYAGM